MIAIATSIFIGIFAAILDPTSLQTLLTLDISFFVCYISLYALMGMLGICLMNEGLRRFYTRSSSASVTPSTAAATTTNEETSDTENKLNVTINHGNTQIAIQIEGKNQ